VRTLASRAGESGHDTHGSGTGASRRNDRHAGGVPSVEINEFGPRAGTLSRWISVC